MVVEFQFYLLMAALYGIARRTPTPGSVIYAAGLAALLFYLYVDATGGFTRFYGAFRFAPYFVLGAALYHGCVRRDLWAMLLAAAAALSFHAYMRYVGRATMPDFPWAGAFGVPGDLFASTLLFGVGLALLCWLIGREFSRAAEQTDKRLGDVTYAVYLIHPAAIIIALHLQLETRFGGGTAYMFVLLVSLALAVLIFRGVECPVMRLRNLFRGRPLYD